MTALTDRLQKELDERSKQFQEMGSQATLAFLRQHLNDPDRGLRPKSGKRCSIV